MNPRLPWNRPRSLRDRFQPTEGPWLCVVPESPRRSFSPLSRLTPRVHGPVAAGRSPGLVSVSRNSRPRDPNNHQESRKRDPSQDPSPCPPPEGTAFGWGISIISIGHTR